MRGQLNEAELEVDSEKASYKQRLEVLQQQEELIEDEEEQEQKEEDARRAKREAPSVDIEAGTHEDPGDALWLRSAIERLDEAQREVLLLREYEQLSYDEIGALLRIPVNTVRSRLFRARMELKALLSPERTEREGSKP